MTRTNEVSEPRVTPAPDWFAKSEEEKAEHTYWGCNGTLVDPSKYSGTPIRNKPRGVWLCVYHSKEEAEARASTVNPEYWAWDRGPATKESLQCVMDEARRDGHAGVIVAGWRDNEWACLKVYPAGEPLPGFGRGEQ